MSTCATFRYQTTISRNSDDLKKFHSPNFDKTTFNPPLRKVYTHWMRDAISPKQRKRSFKL